MTSTVELRENRQAQLTIEVEAKRLEEAKRNAAKRLGKDVRVPGFRAGKAPYHLIVQQVGQMAILEEAADELLNPLLQEAIKEHELEVYSFQDIGVDITQIEPLTLTYQIPLTPKVTLGDAATITVEGEAVVVSDEQVESGIEELRASRAMWTPSLGPVQEGDLATLDLRGDLMDGSTVVDDKGAERLITLNKGIAKSDEERDTEPEADAEGAAESEVPSTEVSSDEETPVAPDINAHLVAMMVNQVKEFPLVYPQDWAEERLAGRTVLYRATLLDLKRRQMPDLDEEFAQSLGDYATMDEVRAQMRENLERDATVREFDRVSSDMLRQLTATSEIEFPEAMVQHEIEDRLGQIEQQFKGYGLTMDTYFAATGKSRADLENEVRAEAEEAVRRSLVITEYARVHDIKAEPGELQKEITIALQEAGQEATQLMELIEKNRDAMFAIYYNRIIGRKAVYTLYTAVTGEEVPEAVRSAFEPDTGEEHDHDHDHDHDDDEIEEGDESDDALESEVEASDDDDDESDDALESEVEASDDVDDDDESDDALESEVEASDDDDDDGDDEESDDALESEVEVSDDDDDKKEAEQQKDD